MVLEPNGARQSAWGAEIVDGHMLACGPNGSIWVVDRDAHEVIVFDQAGRLTIQPTWRLPQMGMCS
jgi:peptidylglycine monooxygenase